MAVPNYGKYITGVHGIPWPTVAYGGTITLAFRVYKNRGSDPHPITDNINGALGDGSLIYIFGSAGNGYGAIDHALLVDNASGTSLTCHMINGTNSTLVDNSDPDFELWEHDLDTSAVYWVPRTKETLVTTGAESSNVPGWGTTRYPFDRGKWDICYNGNSKHYDDTNLHQETDLKWYDPADLYNETNGYQVRIEIIPGIPSIAGNVGRLDLHKRTAGERAIYDDEFVTKGQIEGGKGIRILTRDDQGLVDGYAGDLYKRQNLLVELIEGQGGWKFILNGQSDWDMIGVEDSLEIKTYGKLFVKPVVTNVPGQPNVEVNMGTELWFWQNGDYPAGNATAPNTPTLYDKIIHVDFLNEAVEKPVTHTQQVFFELEIHPSDTSCPPIGGQQYGGYIEVKGWVPPTPTVQHPSLQTRWWFSPDENNPLDIGHAVYYFGVRNGLECQSEMTLSPWGPVNDYGDIVDAADCGGHFTTAQIRHEEKWTGPAGAFTLQSGRTNHTRAFMMDRYEWARQVGYPFMNGSLQVNQDGYYHISTSMLLALARYTPLPYAPTNYDYYGYWGLWLMVYRNQIGLMPHERWHMHSHLDMKETVHQDEVKLMANVLNTESRNQLMSRRLLLQGSTDIWLNADDRICLLLSAHGKDISGFNRLVTLQDGNSWAAVITKHEFNIHWLHDDIEDAKNELAHPNAGNGQVISLDYLDDSWVAPNITRPYMKDYH